MAISRIERERDVHTGVCVCISSAGRQCPGAGSGLPSSNTEFALPDGSTVKRDGGGNIPDELVGELSNEVGTISMANTGAPNSGGSQFFLNTKHNAFLDYFDNSTPSKHPVFGAAGVSSQREAPLIVHTQARSSRAWKW